MFSRCSAAAPFPKKLLYLLWKFQTHSVCVSLGSGLVQIELLVPIDETIDYFFIPPIYKYTCTQEMDCSGSLGQYGDSCHELSVESHLVLSLKFSSAKAYIIIALLAPFSPSLFPEL